jgi:hypothetical protein
MRDLGAALGLALAIEGPFRHDPFEAHFAGLS